MAKKKAKRKALLKGVNLGFLKSKQFLMTAAAMLAIAVVVGVVSFAGGAKTKGRVFSWKSGSIVATDTIPAYTIVTDNPDSSVYQQVFYQDPKGLWNGHYMSVYTETTNPAIGSRSIALNTSGEDVLALKQALKSMGSFRLTKGVNSNTNNSLNVMPLSQAYATQYDGLVATVASPVFDQPTVNFINTVLSDKGLDSSYGTYLKDGKLDNFEIARIFTLATDPGFIGGGTGVVYDYITGNLLYSGAVKTAAQMDSTKWTFQSGAYSGQQAYLSAKGEKTSDYYFTSGFWTQKTTPQVFSRSLKSGAKGNDVKALQSMLNMAKAKHAGDLTYPKLAQTGTYDKATENAVAKYSNYYQAPQSWANKRLMAMLARELNWGLY